LTASGSTGSRAEKRISLVAVARPSAAPPNCHAPRQDWSGSTALNGLFDEWNTRRKGGQAETARLARFGTVDWLFREYFASDNCKERVSGRTRPDYEKLAHMVCDVPTKTGGTIGGLSIRSITPRAADKIYGKIIVGPRGERLRQGEKMLSFCRHAWRVVHRLYRRCLIPRCPFPGTAPPKSAGS
jgi:hypothetical protein